MWFGLVARFLEYKGSHFEFNLVKITTVHRMFTMSYLNLSFKYTNISAIQLNTFNIYHNTSKCCS